MHGQQNFTANRTDDRIHLDGMGVRVFREELLKIQIVSHDITTFAYLELTLFLARAVTHFSWQVDIAGIEKAVINVIVKSFFATHQAVHIVCVDLMNRVPL